MARGERNARHDDRFPAIDAYFGPQAYGGRTGFQVPTAFDFTGYGTQDTELLRRLNELPFDPEVKAALGGPLVGRLAISSYGDQEGPSAGGYLGDLAEYQQDYRMLADGGRGLEDSGAGGLAHQVGGMPGASSIRARLGIPPGDDDTGFAGVGVGRMFAEQHAFGKAPLGPVTDDGVGDIMPKGEAGRWVGVPGSLRRAGGVGGWTPSPVNAEHGGGLVSEGPPAYNGVVPEHVLARIKGYANAGIYDGGDGVGWGASRMGGESQSVDFDTWGYPTVVSQMDVGEDGAGFVGGGDFGVISPSEELANIRREDDSGDEFAGAGWGQPPSAFARRRDRNSDFDR